MIVEDSNAASLTGACVAGRSASAVGPGMICGLSLTRRTQVEASPRVNGHSADFAAAAALPAGSRASLA